MCVLFHAPKYNFLYNTVFEEKTDVAPQSWLFFLHGFGNLYLSSDPEMLILRCE